MRWSVSIIKVGVAYPNRYLKEELAWVVNKRFGLLIMLLIVA